MEPHINVQCTFGVPPLPVFSHVAIYHQQAASYLAVSLHNDLHYRLKHVNCT